MEAALRCRSKAITLGGRLGLGSLEPLDSEFPDELDNTGLGLVEASGRISKLSLWGLPSTEDFGASSPYPRLGCEVSAPACVLIS